MTVLAGTLQALVTDAVARLVRAGLSTREAGVDAELLARHLLQWDRATFLVNRGTSAPPTFAAGYDTLIARRALREPVSMIMGRREFWGLDFEVTRAVLIPRHETEFIVEEAVTVFRDRRQPDTIVDVGTGSGCLAVSLAREFPGARVIATDVSGAALEVAARNAACHDVADRVRCVETNFLDGLDLTADLIVSNPPYVRAGDAPGLRPEVRDYEPSVALFGGPDGLDALRELLRQVPGRLNPGGLLIHEFGYGQEDDLRELIAGAPALSLQRIRSDLQGIPRVAILQRNRVPRP